MPIGDSGGSSTSTSDGQPELLLLGDVTGGSKIVGYSSCNLTH
jgi:hypothetical protein